MPLYAVRCDDCGQIGDVFRKLSEHGDWPVCDCGTTMVQQITAPMTIHNAEIYDYKSTLDGEHVTSRQQHINHMRKHNVFEIGNEIGALMDRKPEPMPDMRAQIAQDYDIIEAKQKRGEL
jgi:putative FmdB family regulatory protein